MHEPQPGGVQGPQGGDPPAPELLQEREEQESKYLRGGESETPAGEDSADEPPPGPRGLGAGPCAAAAPAEPDPAAARSPHLPMGSQVRTSPCSHRQLRAMAPPSPEGHRDSPSHPSAPPRSQPRDRSPTPTCASFRLRPTALCGSLPAPPGTDCPSPTAFLLHLLFLFLSLRLPAAIHELYRW